MNVNQNNDKENNRFLISFESPKKSSPQNVKIIFRSLKQKGHPYYDFCLVPSEELTCQQADLAFERQVEPVWDESTCEETGFCLVACPQGAIHKQPDGKIMFDNGECIFCGRCIDVCLTHSWKIKRKGWAVWVGGDKSKTLQEAVNVAEFVPDSEILDVIDRTIEWYQLNARKNEKFPETLRQGGLSRLNNYIDSIFKK